MFRWLQHIATGIGKVDFLVTDRLHGGQDTEITVRHLGERRQVVVATQCILCLGAEKVIARRKRHRQEKTANDIFFHRLAELTLIS